MKKSRKILLLSVIAAVAAGIILSVAIAVHSANQKIVFYKRTFLFVTHIEVSEENKAFSRELYEKYKDYITQMHVAVGQREIRLSRFVFVSDDRLEDETRDAILDDIMVYRRTSGHSLQKDCEVFFCEKQRPYSAFISLSSYNADSSPQYSITDWEEISGVEGSMTFKTVMELVKELNDLERVWQHLTPLEGYPPKPPITSDEVYKKRNKAVVTYGNVFEGTKAFSRALYEKYEDFITTIYAAENQKTARFRYVIVSDNRLEDEIRDAILDDILTYRKAGDYYFSRNYCEVFFSEKEQPYGAYFSTTGEHFEISDWEEISGVEGSLTFKMVKKLLKGLRPIGEVWK